MKYLKYIASAFLLTTLLPFGCKKEEPTWLEIAYADVLENLKIPEASDTCDYYLKAEINDRLWTYCNGADSPVWRLGIGGKFTTSSPSFNTGQTTSYDNARMGCYINFPDFDYRPYEPHFELHTPDFVIGRDPEAFIDSLFAIKEHRFMPASDVVVPDGATAAEEGLTRAGGGFLTGWKVKLMLPTNDDPVGKLFVESVMGEQDDSYLRINEMVKIDDGVEIKYYLELSFQVNLYHHPQHGKEGLFSVVKNGEFKGVLRL